MSTTYWRAREVERIAAKLIKEHHENLNRHDVPVFAVFRDPVAKSKGRVVLGKARKISGLPAALFGLAHQDVLGDDPTDFFLIEIGHKTWEALTPRERVALVDHELCHFDVDVPLDGLDPRRLLTRGHDLEEFQAVVKRHGLWRPNVEAFAKTASAQLALPIDEQPAAQAAGGGARVLDLRTGRGVVIAPADDLTAAEEVEGEPIPDLDPQDD